MLFEQKDKGPDKAKNFKFFGSQERLPDLRKNKSVANIPGSGTYNLQAVWWVFHYSLFIKGKGWSKPEERIRR